MRAPRPATTQNETRQSVSCRMAAPTRGPTMGAIPPTPAMTLRFRTRRGPVGQVDDDGPGRDHGPAPAEPLDEPGQHHELDRRAHRAGHRGDRQDDERDQQRPAAPPGVGDRATDELPQRHPDEERREGQLHLRRAREQVLADPGEGRHVHVGGQRGDRADEHDRREEGTTDPDRGCRERPSRSPRPGRSRSSGGDGHRLSSPGGDVRRSHHGTAPARREEVTVERCTDRASLTAVGAAYGGRREQP